MRSLKFFAADLVGVVLFVIIGRRSHDEGNAVTGTLRVAAPFLLALVTAWLVRRRSVEQSATIGFGIPVWLVTVVVGLALRRVVFGQGLALPFIIVATLFLALVLLGWRLFYARLARRQRATA